MARGQPKDKGGRPPLFKTVKELDDKIDEYFIDCERRERPPTIAGLAYWLGVDRQTIYNYEAKDKFFGTIKKARDRIIANIEEEMVLRGNGGTVFLAKNYGYMDKSIDAVEKTKAETEFIKLKTKLLQGDEKDVEKLKLIMQALGGD